MANELSEQLDKLSNQARFIQMIVDKELVVSNRKKADIVSELRQRQFRAVPPASKAKGKDDDGRGGNDEEDEEESESNSTDFDYLLKMPIWSLTKEKVGIVLHK